MQSGMAWRVPETRRCFAWWVSSNGARDLQRVAGQGPAEAGAATTRRKVGVALRVACAGPHAVLPPPRDCRSASANNLDRRLVQVGRRIQKHLGQTSPLLAESVWQRCGDGARAVTMHVAQRSAGGPLHPRRGGRGDMEKMGTVGRSQGAHAGSSDWHGACVALERCVVGDS